ncbi:Uncharacterized protein FKW44_012779 [Caligus rogercresseyi]|uniref:Histone-lysine N-methyltransferase SETMAR n=1 Tax=Caligus rogercresseyi TaxID=217165 RepID=A0A7T8HJU8_CALRO|nr:Uncharacterized protein FKW44_012779 [Caligus rogercresseyi]
METRDFRSYLLIQIKLARTVNEIHGDLLSIFPDSSPGLSTLQRWHTEFGKGVFALEKKTRRGCPRETRTEENVARVKRLVEDNPRMATRQVAAEVSLPSTTIFRLRTEDLGFRNLLSVVLLGFGGVEASLAEPTGAREEDDESDGVHLLAEAGIDHCTTCRDHSRRNTMIKDKILLKDYLLMWDNARPHTATDTREFLTRRDVEPVKQSPYSSDLNLCDRFLFRKLKHLLRKDEFGGH